uniref:F-box domain-containing protein n=1 Tax=Brassica oleracea TaxID=3712 RepID=A0A3P6BM47_BRAOL|nr:unnamed protein product [Brassica oleracea]
MNSRGCNVSEDPQTICPSSSQLSAIDDLLLKLPIDLIVEIFSRLPLKSISRCRCVSKRWASFLRRSDFTELFLTKSLSHPKLLFACRTQRELLFFSSPQLQHPDENLSTITADHHMWILRDPEKHGWYPRIFKLPPTWKDVVGGEELLFRGVTATNEFVLSCNCKSSSEPFHVYYYNFIKETITRVEIQGMGAFERGSIVGIFPNHGADVKLV